MRKYLSTIVLYSVAIVLIFSWFNYSSKMVDKQGYAQLYHQFYILEKSNSNFINAIHKMKIKALVSTEKYSKQRFLVEKIETIQEAVENQTSFLREITSSFEIWKEDAVDEKELPLNFYKTKPVRKKINKYSVENLLVNSTKKTLNSLKTRAKAFTVC